MIDARFARMIILGLICTFICCLAGCSADSDTHRTGTSAAAPGSETGGSQIAGRAAGTAGESLECPIGKNGSNLTRSADREPASQPAAAPLTLGQLIRKYPNAIKTNGPRIKEIALTFDDVPDPRFTPQILDVLRRYRVKATFFIVGRRAAKHPALVKRIVREGHSIGNHSYNHPQFTKLSLRQFRSQIKRAENIINKIAGFRPRLIRPPYGEITEQQLKWAEAQGYKLVNWNVDSLDWKGLSRQQVKRNILSHAGKGSIILQHGGGGTGSNLKGTIEALPDVIETLRRKGYTFVTIPEMLNVPEQK
ncbi:polysaccharide deacetylase family sporulation protein PdaB [Paenibacillus sophorae]|uniref:Polysaccharide deacetylase family sporulation protein PdaB n=3 Tax=Paenibacillus sophorae TaxID=1333845 RepID=A0A1H8FV27_9BACL|nr:polysaccharide deacetylase family sporulation protein PdaB [Paenibacillus sophorae]